MKKRQHMVLTIKGLTYFPISYSSFSNVRYMNKTKNLFAK